MNGRHKLESEGSHGEIEGRASRLEAEQDNLDIGHVDMKGAGRSVSEERRHRNGPSRQPIRGVEALPSPCDTGLRVRMPIRSQGRKKVNRQPSQLSAESEHRVVVRRMCEHHGLDLMKNMIELAIHMSLP